MLYRKVAIVMAHPDDEIIFGWPVFQNGDIEKKVLICSSDFYNKERSWCKHRKDALFEICKTIGIKEVKCLDYPSEFYRAPTRPRGAEVDEDGEISGPYRRMYKDMVTELHEIEKDCDAVFTHNPFGEYGHIDHKVLFDIVLTNSRKDIIITDIQQASNWQRRVDIDKRIKRLYYSDKIDEACLLDESLYNFCKKKYESKNAWTWNNEPERKCNLYRIRYETISERTKGKQNEQA